MMDSHTRFEVEMPAGCAPALFLPIYAEQLRNKLASVLARSPEDIRISRQSKEKYSLRLMQSGLSGLEVAVRKKFSLSNELRVVVSVNPYSKTEHVLMTAGMISWALLLLPTFILLLPVVRWLILSFILAVIVLSPLGAAMHALIRLVMWVAYSTFGNDFDVPRRAMLSGVLKQVPRPDPLAALRPAVVGHTARS